MPAPCPFCRSESAKLIRFTAWGGALGPLVMSLRKCTTCGNHFNGRTGRCVKKAIRIYTLTTLLILIGLAALVASQIAGSKTTSKATHLTAASPPAPSTYL